MSANTYFKDVITKKNPLVAKVLVFLRHKCRPDLITEAGWVDLIVVARWCGCSADEIKVMVTAPNFDDRLEVQGQRIRALSAHSISKVREDLLYPKADIEVGTKGYINLKKDPYHSYQEGDTVEPMAGRTSIFLRKDPGGNDTHYARLIVDLYELSQDQPIFLFQDSYVIRGPLPPKYFQYEALTDVSRV